MMFPGKKFHHVPRAGPVKSSSEAEKLARHEHRPFSSSFAVSPVIFATELA